MAQTINFYLIRHGKTLNPSALNGRTDVEVAPNIQEHIATCLNKYSFENIISSPLRRCCDVAKRLQQLSMKPLVIAPEFQELDFGTFDGVDYDRLGDDWSILERFWQDPANHPLPDSEPISTGYHRVIQEWQRCVAAATQDTMIITHGGTIRFILAYLLGADYTDSKWYSVLQIANQSVTHVQLLRYDEQNYFTVKSIGLALPELGA
ncbi:MULTISPECIES: histidine phosphatase family protein [Vibrio]|uniref:Alpha-ribazole phosphatase n=2 Tax=Vibrio TaxID=662 RepID=A0A7X4LK07_9VIBR|nr:MULTISPECIES: histidine phosphatase family protein [Vibrio]MBF9002583.1 histidine phosphatase family protein [Vibrio nitrifigilis]MZI93347.1 alpha-ribazole phosphatase [Vibrio eleionomae]